MESHHTHKATYFSSLQLGFFKYIHLHITHMILYGLYGLQVTHRIIQLIETCSAKHADFNLITDIKLHLTS